MSVKKWEEQDKVENICKDLAMVFIKESCYSLAIDILDLARAIHYDDTIRIRRNYFINSKDDFKKSQIDKIKEYCKEYLAMSF